MNLIFVEGETDCTSEKASGQFSIFGAVEEMGALDFPELVRMRKLVECLSKPHGMRGSDGGAQSENVGEARMGGLSTESAQEMQKGGAGSHALGEQIGRVGIRFTQVEEISRGMVQRKFAVGKSEWGQLLGAGVRTVWSLQALS